MAFAPFFSHRKKAQNLLSSLAKGIGMDGTQMHKIIRSFRS